MKATKTIDNAQDVIDSRDIIERIEELEESEDEDEIAELKILEALADEAAGYSEDWQYGATLIRGSYFTEYAQELCEDIGDLPKNLPSYIEIDWDKTAENIRQDYTSVDFDGVEYWIR